MSPGEFAAKVDWEGGVVDALEYGLKAEDLNDEDPDLKRAWFDLQMAWQPFRIKVTDVQELLERIGGLG